jgi:protein subunit release factor B
MRNKKKWFSITAKDCDFHYFIASGKGGQKRNKTASACRCRHEPSGAVGECVDHREQSKNKKIAFKRMAESAKFQSWIKLKIDAGLGKVDIEHQNTKGSWVKRKVGLDEV